MYLYAFFHILHVEKTENSLREFEYQSGKNFKKTQTELKNVVSYKKKYISHSHDLSFFKSPFLVLSFSLLVLIFPFLTRFLSSALPLPRSPALSFFFLLTSFFSLIHMIAVILLSNNISSNFQHLYDVLCGKKNYTSVQCSLSGIC